MQPELRGPFGLPRSRLDSRVSTRPCGLSSDYRPPSLSKRVHSPASFTSPSEFERPTTCPLATSHRPCDRLEAKERLPWGFVPLRGINWQRPLTTRVTQLRPDAPSVAFLAPSTVYSATSLAGLFHPATTSRVRSSGDCPSPWSLCRLSPTVSLVPVRTSPPALACASEPAPELQGVAPHDECGGPRQTVNPP